MTIIKNWKSFNPSSEKEAEPKRRDIKTFSEAKVFTLLTRTEFAFGSDLGEVSNPEGYLPTYLLTYYLLTYLLPTYADKVRNPEGLLPTLFNNYGYI